MPRVSNHRARPDQILNRDIAGLNALDAGLGHVRPALANEPWVSMPRQASSTT